MNPLEKILFFGLILCMSIVLLQFWRQKRGRKNSVQRRILFPINGHTLSERSFRTALEIAQRQQAALVTIFLANVPQQLPIDTQLPRQSELALGLFEEAERLAAAANVCVDPRVERGRTFRHALTNAVDSEQAHQVVLVIDPESKSSHPSPEDIAWALKKLPAEILIFRLGSTEAV